MTNADGIPVVEVATVRRTCRCCGRDYCLLSDDPARPGEALCVMCLLRVILMPEAGD